MGEQIKNIQVYRAIIYQKMNPIEKKKLFTEAISLSNFPVILSSTFYLKNNFSLAVVLTLTNKTISYHFVESREQKKGFMIVFETIFQMIRIKTEDKSLNTLKPPFGIRFICNGYEVQEFYSQNQKDLLAWENQLKNLMHQFNFHELVKAQKRLGKGNFATVYLGLRLRDQKRVAIKAFGKEATLSQDNGKQAIINELKITKMFNHPNLMKMEEVYESQNSIYVALQYIEGTPVCGQSCLLKFSEVQRKIIMKGVLRGLVQMARQNVVHRDLKPDNIIICNKEAKIIDFGLATISDDPNYLFVRCGTPGYVAPQIINLKDLTVKAHPISDVFSVGCIFYYLIFNKHLFMGSNASDIISLNRECNIVLTGPEFDRLNQMEVDLLKKMLQKEPTSRLNASQALKHPYFLDSDIKIYVPKILMKQSGSCPVELINNDHEATVKFIAISNKLNKKQSVVKSYDRHSLLKNIGQIDINKLLLGAKG